MKMMFFKPNLAEQVCKALLHQFKKGTLVQALTDWHQSADIDLISPS